jgi:hypothetical protein
LAHPSSGKAAQNGSPNTDARRVFLAMPDLDPIEQGFAKLKTLCE